MLITPDFDHQILMCRPQAYRRRWQGWPPADARPCQHQECSLPGSGRAAPGGMPATLCPCCSRGVAPSTGGLQSALPQQLRLPQQRRHSSTRLRCAQHSSTEVTIAATKQQTALNSCAQCPACSGELLLLDLTLVYLYGLGRSVCRRSLFCLLICTSAYKPVPSLV